MPLLRRSWLAGTATVLAHAASPRIVQAGAADDFLTAALHHTRALRSGALDAKGWHAAIAGLAPTVDVDALRRRPEVSAIATLDAPDRGAATRVLALHEAGDGGPPIRVKLFALRRDRALVPHGHRGMVSLHLVLEGRVHGLHYDRVHDDLDHVLLRPAADVRHHPGDVSTMSATHRNVHWFRAQNGPALILGISAALGSGAPERTFLDPLLAERFAGDLLRAPKLSAAEARARYGKTT